jgi:hypothetical protein
MTEEYREIYTVCFSGVYLSGDLLVIGKDQHHALELAKELLREHGFERAAEKLTLLDLTRVFNVIGTKIMIDNGGY